MGRPYVGCSASSRISMMRAELSILGGCGKVRLHELLRRLRSKSVVSWHEPRGKQSSTPSFPSYVTRGMNEWRIFVIKSRRSTSSVMCMCRFTHLRWSMTYIVLLSFFQYTHRNHVLLRIPKTRTVQCHTDLYIRMCLTLPTYFTQLS